MTVTKLTNTYVKNLGPNKKRYSVRDTEIKGLLIRVEPTGKKTFYLDYYTPEGKRSSKKLGDAKILTVAEAREMATIILSKIIRKIPLSPEKKPPELTVGEVFEKYKIFVQANHKSSGNTLIFISLFSCFFQKKCSELTICDLEKWRDKKRKSKKAATINRYVSAFRAMLRWAKERDIISACPAIEKKMKSLPETDSDTKIRYLRPDERKRLFATLKKREERQGKDYLFPAVTISLNTGIRRGALFGLVWGDVNFEQEIIFLHAKNAKNKKMDYIPMNAVVKKVLQEWKKLQKNPSDNDLIFQHPGTGKKMHDCRNSWKKLLRDAEIENFRWHDMRHDFASQLVMKDVNILTVQKLMTHSNLEMTLRYAHLAPKKQKEAVQKIEDLYPIYMEEKKLNE
jgi:integrase